VFRIDKMVGRIVHHDNTWSVAEIRQELLLEPLDEVVAIEDLVVIPGMVLPRRRLEHHDRVRNKPSFVCWINTDLFAGIWALDCGKEAVALSPIRGLLLLKVELVIRIVDRMVVGVVMLMAIGFIQIDLSISLFRRLLAIADELEKVLLALDGNVFLQTDVVRSLASSVAVLLEPLVRQPLRSSERFLIKESTVILGYLDNLFLDQEVQDLPASYVLSSASLVSNEFSYGRHNLYRLRNSGCLLETVARSHSLIRISSSIEVFKDLLKGFS
jgi:hypothetical protein